MLQVTWAHELRLCCQLRPVPFAASYALCRGRFDQELADLTDAQMQWRMYPGSLSIGEMALHLAGVEISSTR